MRSWALPSTVNLTHAACFVPHAKCYLGVRENDTLFSWPMDAPEIDLRCSASLTQPLLTVLLAPALYDCVALVLIDGSALFVKASLQPLSPRAQGASTSLQAADIAIAFSPPPEGGAVAVWSALVPLPSGGKAPLALLTLMRAPDGLTLITRLVQPFASDSTSGVTTIRSVALLEPSASVTLSSASKLSGNEVRGACVVPAKRAMATAAADGGGASSREATLALLWADGELQLWTPQMEPGAPAAGSSPRVSRHLAGLDLKLRGRKRADGGVRALAPLPCSLLSLASPELLLLYGSCGDGKPGGRSLTTTQLWDVRYGMLHAQSQLDLHHDLGLHKSSRSDDTLLQAHSLVVCGGGARVAIACPGSVLTMRVPPEDQPFGLAQALGATLRTSAALASPASETMLRPPIHSAPHVASLLHVSTPAGAQKPLVATKPVAISADELRGWSSAAAARDAKEAGVLKRLLSGEASHSADAFTKLLTEYLSELASSKEHRARALPSQPLLDAQGFAEGELDGDDDAIRPGGGTASSFTSSARAGHARDVAPAAKRVKTAHAELPPSQTNGVVGKHKAEPKRGGAKKNGKKDSKRAAKQGGKGGLMLMDDDADGVSETDCVPSAADFCSFPLSPHFVQQVCERCVREGTREWLLPLRPLLASGAVRSSSCPPLVSAMCETKSLELLVLYVQHVFDLSEAQLLQLLRLALNQRVEAARGAASQHAEEAEASGEASWDALLDRLLSAPRNDVFLLQALRWLSLEDGVLLLERLVELLDERAVRWRASAGSPSLLQVVGWINVLIDAHAAQLLLHAPAHKLLHRLGKIARKHVTVCSVIKSLKGYLAQATMRNSQPAKPVPDYSVEMVQI